MTPHSSRYRGPQPYRDNKLDRILFFGREEEIELLLNKVLASNLVVFFGRSGVGKSSLINAGLLPRLREADQFPVVVRFNPPSTKPLEVLYKSIVDAVDASNRKNPPSEMIDLVEGSCHTLWEYFQTLELWKGECLLAPIIIFDQFEEIFTLHPPAVRQDLFSSLAKVIRGLVPANIQPLPGNRPYSSEAPRVRFIISLREDFVGQLDAMANVLPTILQNRFRLTGLSRTRAARAISNPAKVADDRLSSPIFVFTCEALEEVIDFLCSHNLAQLSDEADEVAPVQLQLICIYCEECVASKIASDDRSATASLTQEDLGGKAKIGEVLQNYYKNVTGMSDKKTSKAVRCLCEKGLIGYSGCRLSLEEDDIEERYRVSTDSLSILVDKRLLNKDVRGSNIYYELSHDTLVNAVLATKDDYIRERQAWYLVGLLFLSICILVALIVTAFLGRNSLEWGNFPVAFVCLFSPLVYLVICRNRIRSRWHAWWSRRFLKQRRPDRAKSLLQRRMRIDPTEESNYYFLGHSFLQEVKFVKASKAFCKAIEYSADDPDNWLGLARARRGQGFFQEAEKAALLSIKLRPLAESYALLALIYGDMKNNQEGLDWVNRGLEQFPVDINLYYAKARLLIDSDICQALELTLTARKMDPDNQEISAFLGDIRIKQTEDALQKRFLSEAKKYIDEAVVLKPEDMKGWYLKAAIAFATGDEAVWNDGVRNLIKLDPSLQYLLDDLRPEKRSHSDVNFTEAEVDQLFIGILQRIIAVDPNDPIAYVTVSSLYDKMNQANEGLKAIQKAISLQPEESSYLLQAAWLLYRLERYEDSVAMSLEGLKKSPRSARAWFNYGLTLLCLGHAEEATKAYRRFLELVAGSKLNEGESVRDLLEEAVGDIESAAGRLNVRSDGILSELKEAQLKLRNEAEYE